MAAKKPTKQDAPAKKKRAPIMSMKEAIAIGGEDGGPELYRLVNAATPKKPKRPPIPVYRPEKEVPPGRIELRQEEGGGWRHYLEGLPLSRGDALEVSSGGKWWPGLYDWQEDPLLKPYLRYTAGIVAGMVCPITKETELRRLAVACSICGVALPNPSFAKNYPNIICRTCDEKAVDAQGKPPRHDSQSDVGDNPVFIDGLKCWRRYRFGGFVTMKDDHNCKDISEFYTRHKFL
jgi:hypothetical protein